MKKKVLIFMMAALMVLTFTACSSKTDGDTDKDTTEKKSGITIGVAMKTLNDQFPAAISDAIKAAADKEADVNVIVQDAQADVSKQLQQVEDFIAQKVDVIILNPQEAAALGAAVDAANKAGIPIVEVNTRTDSKDYTAFVGSDDVDAGVIQGDFIKEKLGGKGNVTVMYGVMGQSGQIDRKEGVDKSFTGTDIKIVADQTAEWQRDKALSLAENWILQFKDLNAIMCQNDDMALGAMEAVLNAKMQDKIIVVGVDAIEGALQSVQKGEMACTVFQDAKGQGEGALATAIKIARSETYDKEVMIPFQLVTKDNVAQYLK